MTISQVDVEDHDDTGAGYVAVKQDGVAGDIEFQNIGHIMEMGT